MTSKYTDLFAGIVASVPPDFVLFFITFVISCFFLVGMKHLFKVKAFTRRLGKQTKIIQESENLDFDSIRSSLGEISPLIREYQELVNEKRNSENCDVILSEENIFRALKVDESALEHYPGIFTALGIAGTFIGILFVLVPIHHQIDQSEQMIDHLLRGAGIAFLTSIVGIFFSVVFLGYERLVVGRFKTRLYAFHMAINGKLERITEEGLLSEIRDMINTSINNELLGIKDALETMADDIGTAVSRTISDALESVSKVLETSISAAGSSSQEIVNNVMTSIEGTLDKFSESLVKLEHSSSLQSDILEQFNRSVSNAMVLADKLETIVPSMESVAEVFEASSQRLERLPDALTELAELQEKFTTVAKESIEMMANNWQTERERLTDLVEELQKQFSAFEDGIASGLQVTMAKFDDELSRAGTYIATWLDRLHEDVNDFRSQIGNLNGVVQNSTSDLQGLMQVFAQSISEQSADLDTHIKTFNSTIKTGFDEIKAGFEQFPSEIYKAVNGIEQIYQTTTQKLPQMLAHHLEDLVKELNKTSHRSGLRGMFKRQ